MPTKITRVVVLHGYGVTPRSMWFPWLKTKIEENGMAAFLPALPEPLKPDLRAWMRALAPHARTWGAETAIVGHSAGALLALRLIEKYVSRSVGPVILVSPPYAATVNVKPYVSFFDRKIDWAGLRKKAASYNVLHAKDDPVVPYDHALRYEEALGAHATLVGKGGHLIGKKAHHVWRLLETMLQ